MFISSSPFTRMPGICSCTIKHISTKQSCLESGSLMTVGLSLKKTLAQRPIISIIRCVVGDQTTSEFCPDGEIGRHKGLKIPRTKHPCRFDPGSGHHSQEDALGHLFSFLAPVNYNPIPGADLNGFGQTWPDVAGPGQTVPISPHPLLSDLIPSRLISSHLIPSHLIQYHTISSHPFLSFPTQSCCIQSITTSSPPVQSNAVTYSHISTFHIAAIYLVSVFTAVDCAA